MKTMSEKKYTMCINKDRLDVAKEIISELEDSNRKYPNESQTKIMKKRRVLWAKTGFICL